MFPGMPSVDLGDQASGYTEISGDVSVTFAGVGAPSDLTNLLGIQLGISILFANVSPTVSNKPSFARCVREVVGLRAIEKVCRVATRRVVAFVAGYLDFFDWKTEMERQRNTMGVGLVAASGSASAYSEGAVPALVSSTDPRPARIRATGPIDMSPEAVSEADPWFQGALRPRSTQCPAIQLRLAADPPNERRATDAAGTILVHRDVSLTRNRGATPGAVSSSDRASSRLHFTTPTRREAA